MSEYISKNVLYEKISELEEIARDRVLNTPKENPKSVGYELQLAERTAFKHLVADQPVAYVRPVVRGKWIEQNKKICCGENKNIIITIRKCGNCGEKTATPYNFCPNCGRDMRGK